MFNLNRTLFWFILLVPVEFVCGMPAIAAPQTTTGIITTKFLRDLAGKLKQVLLKGSVALADLHVIQMRLALKGLASERLTSDVSSREQMTNDDVDPSFTKGLVPTVEKVLEELEKPERG